MNPLLPVVLLWLQFQLGALRPLERLPGAWGEVALAVVWAGTVAAAWVVVRRPPRWGVLATAWPAAALVVLAALCALLVYPEVDGRRTTGGGSDADDAVVLVVERIRDGLDPFGADTYLGNPPTTGPGSALWAVPFPGRRAYALGGVVAVAAALALLRRRHGSWLVPSWTALLLGASVPFWEGIAQGSDHIAMAAWLAVVVAVGVERWPPIATAVGAGVLATWRAAYLHLPVLLALASWRTDRRRAVVLAVAGTGVALVLHLVLLRWTAGGWDAYDPVQQLFVKSDEDLDAWGRAMLAVAIGASVLVVLLEARAEKPRGEVLVLAGIGGPMAAIAVAGAATATEPPAWSEASYLLPTVVLAAVFVARSLVGGGSSSPAPGDVEAQELRSGARQPERAGGGSPAAPS